MSVTVRVYTPNPHVMRLGCIPDKEEIMSKKAIAKSPATLVISNKFSQKALDGWKKQWDSCLAKRLRSEVSTIFYELKMSLLVLNMSHEVLKDKKKYANSSGDEKKRKAYQDKMEELTGFKKDKVTKYKKQGKWIESQSWYNYEFLDIDTKTDLLNDDLEDDILDHMVDSYTEGFLARQGNDFLRRHGNLHPDTKQKLETEYAKFTVPAKKAVVKKTSTTTNTTTTSSSTTPTKTIEVTPTEQSSPVEILSNVLPPSLTPTESKPQNVDEQVLDLYPEDFASDEALEQVLQSLDIDMPQGNFKAIQITWCKAELIEE